MHEKETYIDRFKPGTLHLVGLLSKGGVHSHLDHVIELLKLAKGRVKTVMIHGFLDGRDTNYQSAAQTLQDLKAHCQAIGIGKIASVIGRFYGMDRDKRYDRTKKAYALLAQGVGMQTACLEESLHAHYAKQGSDEHVPALKTQDYQPIKACDQVLFFNFRADRIRQIIEAFLPDFSAFEKDDAPWPLDLMTLLPISESLKKYALL